VFIDDSEVNVASARKYGMAGIHFTTPEALRAELVGYGLPVTE
jgi:FMN phosphatase YigB (HAD superfamily)